MARDRNALADPVIYSGVGERLDWHIRQTGLSLNKYAAAIDHPQNTVSNWRRGIRRPSVEAAEKLCDRFGLTLDFIYRGDDRLLPAHLFEAWRTRDTDVPKS